MAGGETQKRYRIHFRHKGGDQRMTLLARNRAEAEKLALAAQHRRESRFPLTFQRLEENESLTAEQKARELERRKRDQARYDGAGLKIASIEEVK
jgi:hypothetical protein